MKPSIRRFSLCCVLLSGLLTSCNPKPVERSWTSLPETAKTVEEIAYGICVEESGILKPVQPNKKRFQYQDREYLVAFGEGPLGTDGEPYVHAYLYIYNRVFKEWRCFQITHFREIFEIDCELDEPKGQIVITCVGNERDKGKILTTFNLIATSDDASYVHPEVKP